MIADVGPNATQQAATIAASPGQGQDYLTLATDAIAAMHEARRLAGPRAGRIGYQGGSQGGWVAPLAARIEPVDFVIVSFGLAVSPAEEDREAIAYDMQRQGYGADVMAKAMEVADASAIILRSQFREGYRELDAVRAKYGNEPWFKHVHGDITFALLEMPEAKLREQGPLLLAGVPVDYDPMPVLRNLDVPQLWILGTDDTDAPSAETLRRLHALADAGRPISTALFPRADHGIYEYETKADGSSRLDAQFRWLFRAHVRFHPAWPHRPALRRGATGDEEGTAGAGKLGRRSPGRAMKTTPSSLDRADTSGASANGSSSALGNSPCETIGLRWVAVLFARIIAEGDDGPARANTFSIGWTPASTRAPNGRSPSAGTSVPSRPAMTRHGGRTDQVRGTASGNVRQQRHEGEDGRGGEAQPVDCRATRASPLS